MARIIRGTAASHGSVPRDQCRWVVPGVGVRGIRVPRIRRRRGVLRTISAVTPIVIGPAIAILVAIVAAIIAAIGFFVVVVFDEDD